MEEDREMFQDRKRVARRDIVERRTFSLPHIFPNPGLSVCFRKDYYIEYPFGSILLHMLQLSSGSYYQVEQGGNDYNLISCICIL